jgi:hypothetical protein
MYTIHASNGTVRDGRPPYAARTDEPERYPAERVLRDLSRARQAREVPAILARYAALRAWLLAAGPPDPAERALARHARLTASAHLDAASGPWAEGSLLQELIEPELAPGAGWALLGKIATAAERAGHFHGALAARQSAWAGAVRAHRLDAAAVMARDIAALLGRHGLDRSARRWERTARGLERSAETRGAPDPPT